MQRATDTTVLAFHASGASDELVSVRADGTVEFGTTDEEDPITPTAIAYTFGVTPLQQYLVRTHSGRLQALRWSWDARSAIQGGQRWFKLYAEETIPPGDILHWQGPAQNWNSMCADCHSTAVTKNYLAATQSFDTQFEELSVGCEACHGPGANHARDPQVPLPATRTLLDPAKQPDACAQCHSRRSQLAEGFAPGKPLLDYYLPALLTEPLYFADGQIRDEVYVYGSFTSSKMHQQGVMCGDCHEPHSAKLRLPGDALCTQCHSPAGNARFPSLTKANYISPEHHFHPQDADLRCTTCHMPTRTYMEIDDRHDHSFRRPMPRLSEAVESQDVCTDCHAERSAAWAHAAIRSHSTSLPRAPIHFARALRADPATPAGERSLSELAVDPAQPPIARASAVDKLALGQRHLSADAIVKASRDVSPLVRHSAVTSSHRLTPQAQFALLNRALDDPSRVVRASAAQAAAVTSGVASNLNAEKYGKAMAEYVAIQHLNAERPESHLNLAILARAGGDTAQAARHLDTALALNDRFIPALINLADLLRATGRDGEGEAYLQRAWQVRPRHAQAAVAYAMWHVRQGADREALAILKDAHDNFPNAVEVSYTYAVALNSMAQPDAAIALLQSRQRQQHPRLQFLYASLLRDSGRYDEAGAVIATLRETDPGNRLYARFAAELSR